MTVSPKANNLLVVEKLAVADGDLRAGAACKDPAKCSRTLEAIADFRNCCSILDVRVFSSSSSSSFFTVVAALAAVPMRARVEPGGLRDRTRVSLQLH